jgi:hypothetical protein
VTSSAVRTFTGAGRGNLASFVIAASTIFPPTLSLNGQPAPVTAAEGRWRYGK